MNDSDNGTTLTNEEIAQRVRQIAKAGNWDELASFADELDPPWVPQPGEWANLNGWPRLVVRAEANSDHVVILRGLLVSAVETIVVRSSDLTPWTGAALGMIELLRLRDAITIAERNQDDYEMTEDDYYRQLGKDVSNLLENKATLPIPYVDHTTDAWRQVKALLDHALEQVESAGDYAGKGGAA